MTDPGDIAPSSITNSGITKFHDMIDYTLEQIYGKGTLIERRDQIPRGAEIMCCSPVTIEESENLEKVGVLSDEGLLELWNRKGTDRFKEKINRKGLSRALNAHLIYQMSNAAATANGTSRAKATAIAYLENGTIPEGYEEISYEDPSLLQDDTEPILPKNVTCWKNLRSYCFGNKLVLCHNTQPFKDNILRICLPMEDLAILICKYAAKYPGFITSIQSQLVDILKPRFYTPRNLIRDYGLRLPREPTAPQQGSLMSGASLTTASTNFQVSPAFTLPPVIASLGPVVNNQNDTNAPTTIPPPHKENKSKIGDFYVEDVIDKACKCLGCLISEVLDF
jgi:hypothetical protein